MMRHLGPLAVCACIVASSACDGGTVNGPAPPPEPSSVGNATVTIDFGGRAVNADVGGAVEGVRVSLYALSSPHVSSGSLHPDGWVFPKNTATSGGDGTFTLPLNLPSLWRFVSLTLTAPPGYDDTHQRFEPSNAAERPAIRMYPTLVIRPGESIDVRVDGNIVLCGWDGYACRRVMVAGSPGDPVELEIVPQNSNTPMTLGLEIPENPFILEPDDMSIRRLTVPPGRVPYVIGAGTARLTARR